MAKPPKWVPPTFHALRLPSLVRTNAPFLVPTRTLTRAIGSSGCGSCPESIAGTLLLCNRGNRRQSDCSDLAGFRCRVAQAAGSHGIPVRSLPGGAGHGDAECGDGLATL